jgi:hypothetical protein
VDTRFKIITFYLLSQAINFDTSLPQSVLLVHVSVIDADKNNSTHKAYPLIPACNQLMHSGDITKEIVDTGEYHGRKKWMLHR